MSRQAAPIAQEYSAKTIIEMNVYWIRLDMHRVCYYQECKVTGWMKGGGRHHGETDPGRRADRNRAHRRRVEVLEIPFSFRESLEMCLDVSIQQRLASQPAATARLCPIPDPWLFSFAKMSYDCFTNKSRTLPIAPNAKNTKETTN